MSRLSCVLSWVVLLLGCTGASVAPGRTIFVSVTGNDQADGKAESPLRTISRAASIAKPGDTVLVRGGVYRERVAPARGGEPGRPITYRAVPGERVVVKGSDVWSPEWQSEGEGVYSAAPAAELFDDRSSEYVDSHIPFAVELSSTPWGREGLREHERREAGDTRIHETDPRIVYTCGQVFVNGQQYLEVPLREELKSGAWWWERGRGAIHVHFGERKPTEQTVEISTRRRIFAPKRRGLGHVVVEGFVFEHCGNQYPTNFWKNDAYAQKGAVGTEAGHDWVIRRNVVRHVKAFAIDVGRVDRHGRYADASNNLVEQNYIVDNGAAGILSNGSTNLVIRDNVILRNNTLRFDGIKRWEQAGVKCHHFDSGRIEHNYIADNHTMYGVWLDNQFPDSRVTRNVIVGNGAAGVFLEMSDYGFDRVLIDNNLLIDNAQNAVYIHDASGGTFVHNLLANTRPTPDRGQAVFIRQATTRTKSYHHSFFNNLMLGNPHNVDVNYPAARSGPQRFDGNVYGVAHGGRAFRINPQSDKPNPWTPDEFRRLVRADLSGAQLANQVRFTQDGARMNLATWRAFWHEHGIKNDRQSQFADEMSVAYNAAKQELTLICGTIPEGVDAVAYAGVTRDLLGVAIPANGAVTPGPLQNLKPGENRLRVWDGLPILAAGELPPVDWNHSE